MHRISNLYLISCEYNNQFIWTDFSFFDQIEPLRRLSNLKSKFTDLTSNFFVHVRRLLAQHPLSLIEMSATRLKHLRTSHDMADSQRTKKKI